MPRQRTVRRYSERPSLARRAFMAVASLLFTTVGLVVVVSGEGADRIWGLISVLLFGVGGVVWFLVPRLTRSVREGVRTEMVSFRGERRPALVFPFSRAKRRVALVGAAVFTAVGILFVVYASALAESGIRYRDPAWLLFVGIFCTVVFGFVTLLGLANELSAGTSVALLPEGILARGPVSSFVPWDAVADVATIEIRGTPMVAVVARDPDAVETTALGRILMLLGRKWTGVDLGFTGLVAPLGVLEEAIREYVEHPEERARIGSSDPAALLHAAESL